MKQYCRYCCEATLVEDDQFTYCDVKKRLIPRSTAIRPNNCKHFEFNAIDVFEPWAGPKYKPRNPRPKQGTQLRMEV